MPRTRRILLENIAYHVTIRGSQQQTVFKDDKDYSKFYHLLWKYKNKFVAKIYAYCFMANHVHLMIAPYSPESLGKMMHGLGLSYAMHFNYKYKKCGHLWQNRYKSFLVQKDEYLINLISYIEYNPIRAEICPRAEDYPWSSYRGRVLGTPDKVLDKYEV